MKRQMWLKLPRKNLSQDRYTWTLCTLEWANVACKLLMNVAPWTMPDTCTICFYLSQELWQLYPQVAQFKKENYQITTSDGLSLSNQQTAELMLKETQQVLSSSPSQGTVLWTITSPTISMSKTPIMMAFNLESTKNIKPCWKKTLISMIG